MFFYVIGKDSKNKTPLFLEGFFLGLQRIIIIIPQIIIIVFKVQQYFNETIPYGMPQVIYFYHQLKR